MQGNQSLKELIQQRRRSSVKNFMTKEPIENFLGVVLKPVIKDPKDERAPQQAQQMLKVIEKFFLSLDDSLLLSILSSRSNCFVVEQDLFYFLVEDDFYSTGSILFYFLL